MLSKITFRTLLFILLFSLLSGCASTSGPRSSSTQPRLSANQYLQMAANATGLTKQAYLLQAANRLIDEKNTRL